MADAPAEHRQSNRIDLGVPAHAQERPPGWVFKPVAFTRGPAGLVINLSDGGLQVLTSATEPLDDEQREVVLLLGQDAHEETVTWFSGQVQRAWSKPLPQMGILHGLRFISRNSTAEKFLQGYQGELAAGQWVRCVLLKASA